MSEELRFAGAILKWITIAYALGGVVACLTWTVGASHGSANIANIVRLEVSNQLRAHLDQQTPRKAQP